MAPLKARLFFKKKVPFYFKIMSMSWTCCYNILHTLQNTMPPMVYRTFSTPTHSIAKCLPETKILHLHLDPSNRLCQMSMSGTLHQNPVVPLLQDVFVRISASAAAYAGLFLCKMTVSRSPQYDYLCKISVDLLRRIL